MVKAVAQLILAFSRLYSRPFPWSLMTKIHQRKGQRTKIVCSWNIYCDFFRHFQKLVCKVDQLVKRRAKSGLIKVKVDWDGAKEFVAQHIDKEIKVCT